jgi:hypothetical protein
VIPHAIVTPHDADQFYLAPIATPAMVGSGTCRTSDTEIFASGGSMKKKLMFSAVVSAVTVSMAAVALAQTPAPSAQTPSASSAPSQEQTIVGCVVRESDYRASRDAGKGGAAGTGIGAGNEFVLTNASPKSSASGTAGTAGTTGAGAAYELSGPGEGQLSAHVGKRVEITGKVKAAATSASGRPTGGATAGAPPSGVDATSKDLKLREFEVASVKEAQGSCSTK